VTEGWRLQEDADRILAVAAKGYPATLNFI
jgi:hypothetical protein